MNLPPEVIFILLIIVVAVRILKAVLAKRAKLKGTPAEKTSRTYEMEEELRKFLQSVSGEEITEETPPPKTQPPPPPVIAPLPMPQPPQRRQPVRSTVQVPAAPIEEDMPRHPIAAPLSQVTEPFFAPQPIERLTLLPRVSHVVPREVAPAAPAVSHPPSIDRLLAILANRSVIQQGIVLSEVLGPPKTLRD